VAEGNKIRERVDELEADINGKADRVSNAIPGNFAGLDENGNLTDSGISPDDIDSGDVVFDNKIIVQVNIRLEDGTPVPGVYFNSDDIEGWVNFTACTDVDGHANLLVPIPPAGTSTALTIPLPIDIESFSTSTISLDATLGGTIQVYDIIAAVLPAESVNFDTSTSVQYLSGLVESADLWGIGGGGAGGSYTSHNSYVRGGISASGGGSGHVHSVNGVNLSIRGLVFSIEIGAGAPGTMQGVTFEPTRNYGGTSRLQTYANGARQTLLEAAGGQQGAHNRAPTPTQTGGITGGKGGSGGGGAIFHGDPETATAQIIAGQGGSDGGDGGGTNGGSGAGTTTRIFGDPDGELVGGGGGAVIKGGHNTIAVNVSDGGLGGGGAGKDFASLNETPRYGNPGTLPGAGGGGALASTALSSQRHICGGAGANGLVAIRWIRRAS
jgi:hypothetical protein